MDAVAAACPLAPIDEYRLRRSELMAAQARRWAHKQRCSALPPMRPGEAEDMVAAFIAARGVTQCPPAYAATVQQMLPPAPHAAQAEPAPAAEAPVAQAEPAQQAPAADAAPFQRRLRAVPIPAHVIANLAYGSDLTAATEAPVMRRNSSGVVWNTWLGEPAAAHTGSSAIRSSSSSSSGGVMWPIGATPPMAKPVVARTQSASARPSRKPSAAEAFETSTRLAPEAMMTTARAA